MLRKAVGNLRISLCRLEWVCTACPKVFRSHVALAQHTMHMAELDAAHATAVQDDAFIRSHAQAEEEKAKKKRAKQAAKKAPSLVSQNLLEDLQGLDVAADSAEHGGGSAAASTEGERAKPSKIDEALLEAEKAAEEERAAAVE